MEEEVEEEEEEEEEEVLQLQLPVGRYGQATMEPVSGERRLSLRRRWRRDGIWTSRLCICRIFPHFTFRYPIELLMKKKSRFFSSSPAAMLSLLLSLRLFTG